ncbi:hypothetical protein PAHAL_3G166900 [Panicum hallii]|uniref:Uncharacterized protein n=1 Tax=Panicum hallii TaxID=206008 RepID=A0A2T8KII1_9POAL|nr:hypothetical protein PAHAL_3G166900 [Panicum hallii]
MPGNRIHFLDDDAFSRHYFGGYPFIGDHFGAYDTREAKSPETHSQVYKRPRSLSEPHSSGAHAGQTILASVTPPHPRKFASRAAVWGENVPLPRALAEMLPP